MSGECPNCHNLKSNLDRMDEIGLLGSIDNPKPKALEELKAMLADFTLIESSQSMKSYARLSCELKAMIEKIVEILDERT